MAVAGQRPLGQQVVGCATGRGCVGPAGGGPVAPTSAARAETWAAARSSTTGPTTTGPVAEVVGDDAGAALSGSSTPPSSTTSRSPWVAHRASMPAARRTGVPRRRGRSRCAGPGAAPSTTRHAAAVGPAQGAGAREHAPRRPRRAARSRRPAPRAGRPRRRGPRPRGRRPRRWRRRPRGRSAARRRGRRRRPRGRATSSTLDSTTSIASRTRSTVCWRVITPARVARGGAEDGGRGVAGAGAVVASRYQSTKPLMPAWRISPTQDRSSALRSREPRHVVVHPGHRGRAERAGRAPERRRPPARRGAAAARALVPRARRCRPCGRTDRTSRMDPRGPDRDPCGTRVPHHVRGYVWLNPTDLIRRTTSPGSASRTPHEVQYVTIHGHRRAFVKAGSGPGAAAPARPRLRPHDLGAGASTRWPGATP